MEIYVVEIQNGFTVKICGTGPLFFKGGTSEVNLGIDETTYCKTIEEVESKIVKAIECWKRNRQDVVATKE